MHGLQQNVIRGKLNNFRFTHYTPNLGFKAITDEVSYMAFNQEESKQRMLGVLQQMFPALAESDVDDMTVFTESYHQYKKNFVKHLLFDPNNKNLSK